MEKMIKRLIISISTLLIFASCGSQKGSADLYNPKEVDKLSQQLGISLSNTNKDDDKYMPLYAECSLWLGTPYRYGGMNMRGSDCSGFTYQVYYKVYRKKLPRSTAGLAKSKHKKVAKSKLQPGDLILFATGKSKKQVTHVGIYLKEGKFVHASTSKGVIVNHIDDTYYKTRWVKAIRVL